MQCKKLRSRPAADYDREGDDPRQLAVVEGRPVLLVRTLILAKSENQNRYRREAESFWLEACSRLVRNCRCPGTGSRREKFVWLKMLRMSARSSASCESRMRTRFESDSEVEIDPRPRDHIAAKRPDLDPRDQLNDVGQTGSYL